MAGETDLLTRADPYSNDPYKGERSPLLDLWANRSEAKERQAFAQTVHQRAVPNFTTDPGAWDSSVRIPWWTPTSTFLAAVAQVVDDLGVRYAYTGDLKAGKQAAEKTELPTTLTNQTLDRKDPATIGTSLNVAQQALLSPVLDRDLTAAMGAATDAAAAVELAAQLAAAATTQPTTLDAVTHAAAHAGSALADVVAVGPPAAVGPDAVTLAQLGVTTYAIDSAATEPLVCFTPTSVYAAVSPLRLDQAAEPDLMGQAMTTYRYVIGIARTGGVFSVTAGP